MVYIFMAVIKAGEVVRCYKPVVQLAVKNAINLLVASLIIYETTIQFLVI